MLFPDCVPAHRPYSSEGSVAEAVYELWLFSAGFRHDVCGLLRSQFGWRRDHRGPTATLHAEALF